MAFDKHSSHHEEPLKTDKLARKYIVRGRVQGVGFRNFVEKRAVSLGINGYVRNLDDGTVETYAIGSPEQLSELAGLLWKGPRSAVVRGVEELEAPIEAESEFRIRA